MPGEMDRAMRQALLAAIGTAALALPASAADRVVGDWVTKGGKGIVRVAPCPARPEAICGTIVRLRQPTDAAGVPLKDIHNQDPTLRGRPIVGLPVLPGLAPAGDRVWSGHIYDPETGRTYASKIRLRSDEALAVEGCLSVLCRTEVWRRAAF
jgi:uncharacterized protein (DUF2147 family)